MRVVVKSMMHSCFCGLKEHFTYWKEKERKQEILNLCCSFPPKAPYHSKPKRFLLGFVGPSNLDNGIRILGLPIYRIKGHEMND